MPALSPPLVPDSEDAREWLLEELSREPYSQSPSFWEWLWSQIERIIQAITSYGNGLEAVFLPLVVVALVAGIIILAFLYGPPARRGRRVETAAGGMWQEGDARTASALQQSASRAAAAGDYSLAVIELFRASVRGLEERGTIETTAGMTATEVAQIISGTLPGARDLADLAATTFNGARYGALAASEADYRVMREFDSALTEVGAQ